MLDKEILVRTIGQLSLSDPLLQEIAKMIEKKKLHQPSRTIRHDDAVKNIPWETLWNEDFHHGVCYGSRRHNFSLEG